MRRTVILASRFTVALASLFVLSNFVLLRTSIAADFKVGDFKGTYVSGLPGDAAGTGPFHGELYLVADGAGGVTGYWLIVDADTHDAFARNLDTSYTVSPDGLVVITDSTTSVIDSQLQVFLVNNNKEILGHFILNTPVIGVATVHGVQQ